MEVLTTFDYAYAKLKTRIKHVKQRTITIEGLIQHRNMIDVYCKLIRISAVFKL